jgi:hypothetical protein
MSAALAPSVPLALTVFGLALVGLEGGPVLRQYGPKVRETSGPDWLARSHAAALRKRRADRARS